MPRPISAIGTARRGGSGASRSRSANISSTGSGSAAGSAFATGAGSAARRRLLDRLRIPLAAPARAPAAAPARAPAAPARPRAPPPARGTAARRERPPPAANSSPSLPAAWLQVSGSSSALSTAPEILAALQLHLVRQPLDRARPEAGHLRGRALVQRGRAPRPGPGGAATATAARDRAEGCDRALRRAVRGGSRAALKRTGGTGRSGTIDASDGIPLPWGPLEGWQSPVDCSCLESSRSRKGPGGSNPSPSAR